MQNVAALGRDLRSVAQLVPCDDVEIARSQERWNPIAAIVVRGMRLSSNVEPPRIDIRVPIPDLYGFASDATVLLTPTLLRSSDAGGLAPVPFCRPLSASERRQHAGYFADMRTGPGPGWGFYLCLMPTIIAPRYEHLGVSALLTAVQRYLSAPVSFAEKDLRRSQELWRVTGDPWWLVRMGYMYEGLRDPARAVTLYRDASHLLPHSRHLERLITRARRAASVAARVETPSAVPK